MPSLRYCSALSISNRHSYPSWKCSKRPPLDLNWNPVRLFCATAPACAETATHPATTSRSSTTAATQGVSHISKKARNHHSIPPFSPSSGVGGRSRRTHHHQSFQSLQQTLPRLQLQPRSGVISFNSPAFSRSFETYSTRRSFDDRFTRHSLPPTQQQLSVTTSTRRHQLHTLHSSPPSTSSLSNSFSRPRISSKQRATFTMTHSHGHGGHAHTHDNIYLTSSNKNDAGVRITRIGLYSNLGMAIAKAAGGYAFNSQSMIADAWHSLTDLASDILTLATVSWSLKPPTEKFPLGFGKVESLGSLGVSGMLLFGGLFMCMNSCTSLYAHFFLDPAAAAALLDHGHSHGHSHSHGVEGPSLHAAWLAAGTVAIKEWLYHATMKVARERKSSVLASNAIHHRVDSLTGIVTLVAILGANFLQNAAWLDPVGGLLISLLVIKAGWGNTISGLYELADRSIDDEVKKSIRRQARKGLETVSESHEVEIREVSGVKSGQNYLVDVEVAVPSMWTIEDVQGVEEAIRAQVGNKVRGVRRVRVRFVPKDLEVAGDEFIPGDVSPKSSPEPEGEEDEHDHDHGDGHHHKAH
ncbi:Cation efflux family domain containing protein [Rhypophila decipiens]